MARRDPEEVRAEMARLPWQQREAINEAVSEGRAVEDERLAPLAAEWANQRRRQTARMYLRVVGPLTVLGSAGTAWLVASHDPEGSIGAAIAAGAFGISLMALIIWAVGWRPFVRAEQANRALAGTGPPPSRREPSHWVIAWLVAWPIAAIVGLLLRAAGVRVLAGPLGIVVWVALVWAVKRALDSQ